MRREAVRLSVSGFLPLLTATLPGGSGRGRAEASRGARRGRGSSQGSASSGRGAEASTGQDAADESEGDQKLTRVLSDFRKQQVSSHPPFLSPYARG